MVVGCLICPQSEHSRTALENRRGEPHYAVEGTDTSSRRLFLRLQDALLPFLGAPWMNFTHTLSCLNCTRNLSHRNISHVIKHNAGGRRIDQNNTMFFLLRVLSYSSEMSMLSCSRSAAVAPMRWSLVMISIRCSLLSKKSPLMAEADP